MSDGVLTKEQLERVVAAIDTLDSLSSELIGTMFLHLLNNAPDKQVDQDTASAYCAYLYDELLPLYLLSGVLRGDMNIGWDAESGETTFSLSDRGRSRANHLLGATQ